MNIFDLQCQINNLKDCCHDDIHYVSVHIAGQPAYDKKIAVNYLTGLLYFRDVNGFWALYTPPSIPTTNLSLTTNGVAGAATYNPTTKILNIPNYDTIFNVTVNGIPPDENGNIQLPDTVTGDSTLEYRALLTQTGTFAPTSYIQANTLGSTPLLSRVGPGVYHITDPTFSLLGTNYHIQSGQAFFSAVFIEPNILEIRTDESDDLLLNTPIEIKVYS